MRRLTTTLHLVIVATCIILWSADAQNTGGGRRTPGRRGQRLRQTTGNLITDKPINPSQGRGGRAGAARRRTNRKRDLVTEEKINELSKVFKINIRRMMTYKQLDLIFLIDESYTVGEDNFLDEIKFIARFVSGIEVDSNHTRVAVITFSDNVTIWVNQVSAGDIHTHKCSLLGEDLPNIVYKGGATYTKLALETAGRIFENARSRSRKFIFLITDGLSTGPGPLPAASALKRRLVEIFTFGIRDGDPTELREIASVHKDHHTFILNSFNEFDMLARRALHSDLESGRFIVEDDQYCDKYCTETNCCHVIADCRCGTTTGQYQCVCRPGYYGTAFKENGCLPCPEGTFKDEALPGDETTCISCPDRKMTSPAASTSFNQCTCSDGYKKEGENCVALTCDPIILPINGHFTTCDGHYQSTCTIACDKGHDLQGTATVICGRNEEWTTLNGSERIETFCQVRYCEPLELLAHGDVSCSNGDNSYSTRCDVTCEEGYQLVGSSERICEANQRWTGTDGECREIKCPPILSNNHTTLTGDCTTTAGMADYGNQCSFSCPLKGFELAVAPTVTCSNGGLWHPAISEEDNIICRDTELPTISCPSDITVSTKLTKPYAEVTWSEPTADDNSGTVTVTPIWSFPVPFRIGQHEVTYTATDESGLVAQCRFTVTVEDKEAPMVDHCPGPQPIIVQNGVTEVSGVTWTEPTFTDNSGFLEVTGKDNNGTFPIGVTQIEYTATDKSSNSRTCTIDIVVQDHTCTPPLEEPRNGHIDCQVVSRGTACEFICDSNWYGFAMISFGHPRYVCAENDVEWSPERKIPYDCSKQKFSSEALKDYQFTYDMNILATCNDTDLIEAVRQYFYDYFSVEIPKLCEGGVGGHLQCSLEEVTVKCIGVVEVHETDDYGDGYEEGYEVYGNGDYYYPDEKEEEDRRKRSVTQKRAKNIRGQRSPVKRAKRQSEDEPPIYYDDDDDDSDSEYYTDDGGNYYPGGGDLSDGNLVPQGVLLDSSDDPTDVDVTFNADGVIPDGVLQDISESVPDIIPPNLLGQSPTGTTREKLEVLMTIRGIVTMDGNTHDGDLLRHTRMVEFLTNLDLQDMFTNGDLNEIPEDKINTDGSDTLIYADETYAHTQRELICPLGTVLKDRAYCVNCPVGSYYDVITAICTSCPEGSFQDHEAQLSCKPCPTGTSTGKDGIHARGLEECKNLCGPGFYSENGVDVCRACPIDTFVDFSGAFTCVQCSPGTGTVSVASTSMEDCGVLCEAGFISATGFAPCYPCPAGSFQPQPGKTLCHSCPGGRLGDVYDDFIACEDIAPGQIQELEPLYFDECFTAPCANNATCVPEGTSFSCDCQPGFTGELCETEINECEPSPCAETANCTDLLNGFRCECGVGYTGRLCDEDINECEVLPCLNGATCVDLHNAFACVCDEGFEGEHCETDINECTSAPCENGGTCVDLVAAFFCQCPPGFDGTICQKDIDDCASDPCQNGATCNDGINEFSCSCKPGFTGDACEVNIDECASDPCVNGECLDLVDSYKCLCPPTYIGQHCDQVGDPYFDLTFNNPNTYHHVKVEHALPNMTEVTVSFYLTCNSSETYGTPFSYAVGDGKEADTLTLTDLTAPTLYVNGKFVVSDTRPLCDSYTHLVTVVWTSGGGNWSIYLNGTIEDNGEGLAAGESIPGGGILVIGQEQDKLGGGFSASQEFLGTISQFNIYNYAFTGQQVFLLYRNCADNIGNVRAWAEMGEGIIGQIERTNTSLCLPCPTVESDEGTVVEEQNEYTIVVRCNTGHKLVYQVPKNLRKMRVYPFRCGNDAVWKFRGLVVASEQIKCEKVTCPDLAEISLGTVSETGTKYGDVATYSCIDGYGVVGDEERTCQADRTWSGSPPLCEDTDECTSADACHSQANCTNSVGSYSCACVYGWKGNGHICEEIYCGGAGFLQSGSIQGNNFKLGGVVTYSCDYGYRLEGPNQRTCLENDSWSGDMPTCVKVECPEPERVLHSSKKPRQATWDYKSQVTYTCHPGYEIVGESVRECGPDSRWTGELPQCVRVSCGIAPEIDNAISITEGENKYGDIMNYACYKEYRALGDMEMRCNASRQWEPPNDKYPVCEHPTCDAPPSILNGEYEIVKQGEATVTDANYTYATEVLYTCNIGYNLVGESLVTCIEREAWDKSAPRCDIVSCGPPPTVENANQENSGELYGDLANYLCDPGYLLEGEAALTCLASGKWTDDKQVNPSCNPRPCKMPEEVAHSQQTLTGADGHVYKAIVTFECDLGYWESGHNVINCNTEGLWEPEQNFVCDIAVCPSPQQPQYGSVSGLELAPGDVYEYNNTVLYSCDAGFYPVGDLNSRCTEYGNWSTSTPTCLPVACELPDIVLNSGNEIVDGPYGTGAVFQGSIVYTCDIGYEQTVGNQIRVCTEDGTWNGVAPVCSRVQCGPGPGVSFSTQLFEGYDTTSTASNMMYMDVIIYYCDQGFYLEGQFSVECTAERTFTPVPTCEPLPCGEPPILQYADYEVEDVHGENAYQSRVTYICEADFRMSGDPEKICNENGIWESTNPPTCEPITCGEPDGVVNAFQFVSSSEDNVAHPEIYKSGFYQPRSSAITACDRGYEIIAAVGQLKSSSINSDEELASHINTKAIDKLSTANRDRIEKILRKIDETSQPAGLVSGRAFTPSSNPPKTLYVQQCSETVGWLKSAPECHPMFCSTPMELENAHLKNTGDAHEKPPFGNGIQYLCDEGYKFADAELINETRVSYCEWSDDLWDVYLTALPECLPLPCPIPPDTPHGSYSEPNGENFVFQDLVTYECDEGYEMNGSPTLHCQSSQTWDTSPPSCDPVKCPEPVAPENGKFKGKKWIYQSEILFHCNRGFNLNGVTNFTCQADRTWSDPYPQCDPVPCGPPPEVDNANVLATSEVFEGCAVYTCKHGFYLHGYSKVKCTASGTWQQNLPTCEFMLCPKPPVMSHVVFADTVLSDQFSDRDSGNYIYDDIVTYSCEEGYETNDQNNLSAMCLTGENIPNIPSCTAIEYITDVISGFWSRPPPVCTAKDCGQPPQEHENGIVVVFDTTFNNTAHYQCKRGYFTNDEDPTATCMANAEWSRDISPECLPVPCGAPDTPENGYFNSSGFTYQEIVKYGCNEGHDLVGPASITCLATGSWSDRTPVCEPKDCGKLPLISNSELSFEDTVFGEEAIYTCDSGYYLKGRSVFECMADGMWSHPSPPKCPPVDCGVLKNPVNGLVNATGHVFMKTAAYSCLPGYYLVGENKTECLEDASWSSSMPVCNPVDCGEPPPLENAQMRLNGSTTFKSTQKYFCNSGYEMKTNGLVTCTANKTWSSLPICERVKCPAPVRPAHGVISEGASVKYLYKDEIGYSCNQGYFTDDVTNSACTAEKTWSNAPPKCNPVDCGELSYVVHGRKFGWETTFMTVVHYSCWPGFYIVGNSSIECLHTGEWSSNPPLCERVSCGRPPQLQHGSLEGDTSLDKWVYEAHIMFVCDDGYHLHGGSGAECDDEGEWLIDYNYYDEDADTYEDLSSEPECQIIHCDEPPSIEHGVFVEKEYVYGDIVRYTCDEGYEKDFKDEVVCKGKHTIAKGNYTGDLPVCSPVPCGEPTSIKNGSVGFFDTVYQSIATYLCDEGHNMIGDRVAECQADKRWSSTPRCDPKNCGLPELPSFVNTTILSTFYPTKITIECENGYEFQGSDATRMLACTSESTWFHEPFQCTPVNCGSPSEIENGVLSNKAQIFRSTASYECNPGYNLIPHGIAPTSGVVTIKCQADATWQDGVPSCEPVECGIAPTIQNGFNDASGTIVYPETVTYTCNYGHSFGWLDDTTIDCTTSGRFSGPAPNCHPVSCGPPFNVQNAGVEAEAFTYQNLATYTCKLGYVFVSDEGIFETFTSQCTGEGFWRPLSPSEGCVPYDCGPPLILVNAEVPDFTNNTKYSDQFTYTCIEGHEAPDSTTTVTCERYGIWSVGPDCQPVDCGPVDCPTNAVCEGTGTIFESEFQAECIAGYEFLLNVNSYSIQCQADATWEEPQGIDNSYECVRISCGPPPVVENAQSTTESSQAEAHLFEAQFQYQCDSGHNMVGSTDIITCLDDGTWGPTSPPTCEPKDCGEPPPCIDKANCTFETTTFKSYFTVSCNEGYELEYDVPIQNLRCQDTGEWEEPESEMFACLSVECGVLPTIRHGRPVQTKQDGKNPTYLEKAGYECEDGYFVEGVLEVTCKSDRTYTAVPECQPVSCGTPLDVENGHVNASGKTFQHEAVYHCDPGYFMEGDKNWICSAMAKWEAEVKKKNNLEIVQMEPVPLGRAAAAAPREYSTHDLQVLLSEASGTGDTGEGSGQENMPRETKIDRVDPIVTRSRRDISAQMETGSGQDTIVGKSLLPPVLILDSPAVMPMEVPPISEPSRPPSCHPVPCGVPPTVANTVEMFTTSLVFKESVTYQCKPGFEMIGEPDLHCQSNGRLGPHPPPKCARIRCPTPEGTPHCKLSGSIPFKFEDTLVYQPAKGYKFSPLVAAPMKINCMADGRSSVSELPMCVPVSCGMPAVVMNGIFEAEAYTYQQTATYSCYDGYELTGPAEITCLSTRQWSPEAPECRPVSCGAPPFLTHGTITTNLFEDFDPFTYGRQIDYACDLGFMFDSDEVGDSVSITCQYNRKWDASPPECVPVPCPAVAEVPNGEFNASGEAVFRAQVRYGCNIGHEMEGEPVILCQASGEWSSNPPICNPVSCDSPPIVPYSVPNTLTELTYKKSITYECIPGYHLVGYETLTCQWDQSFDYPTPVCAPIECSAPKDLEFGYFLKEAGGFLFMSSVTYRCSEGYRMISEEDGRQYKSVSCQANKTWSGGAPECEIVSCGEPQEIKNGYVDYTSTTYNSMIAYSCEPGYEIRKNSTYFKHCLDVHVCKICQENGIWGNGNSETAPALPICRPVSCGEPPVVEHARSESDSLVFQGATVYTCDTGYEFPGVGENFTLECWSNAQWGPSPLGNCERVECPAPPEIEHGKVVMIEKAMDSETFLYEDVIEYICDTGHELSVIQNLTCTSEKTWDVEPPSCEPVDCGPPPMRTHGYLVESNATTTVYLSEINYQCDVGYEYNGEESDEQLICTDRGIWSSVEPPPCTPVDCGLPPEVYHGTNTLTSNRTTYRSEVEYECDIGHELSGDRVLTCHSDKFWKPSAPTCNPVSCSVPPSTDHSFPNLKSEPLFHPDDRDHASKPEKRDASSVSGYIYQDTVAYDCEIGYKLIGNQSFAQCDEDGNWVDVPTCEIVTCEPLVARENSERHGENKTYGSEMIYECDEGYIITSNETSFTCVCGADGYFGPVSEQAEDGFCKEKLPECRKVSCGAPPRVNNAMIENESEEYVYQDEITYTCVEGYKLKGNDVLTCKPNGRYSHRPPKCRRVSCGSPPPIINADTNIWQGTKYGDVVTYDCHHGHLLTSESAETVCQSDGQWSDDYIRCDPVNCTEFQIPENGVILAPYNRTFGSVVLFGCQNGHDLFGREVISCEASGNWSAVIPECMPIPCDPIPEVDQGIPMANVMLPRYKDVVSYLCIEGHVMNGSAEISCLESGKWTKPPGCNPVKCPEIPQVPNAVIENEKRLAFTYQQQVSYTCNPGYQLSSMDNAKTCQADGRFSDNEVTCSKIPCPPAPDIEHGGTNAGQSVYLDKIFYTCHEGYVMFGGDFLVCGIIGAWIGSHPTCEPRSCGRAPLLEHGFISTEKEEYVYQEFVDYRCDEGFEFEHVASVKCEANGTFSDSDVKCLPVTCRDLEFGPHVVYESEAMTYMSEAIARCEKGFVLENGQDEEIFICQANKTWSGDFSSVKCLPIECPIQPVFNNGEVKVVHSIESPLSETDHEHGPADDRHVHVFGAQLTFSCNEGYALEGASELNCTHEGRWTSLPPTCSPVPCGQPPIVENAVVINSSFTYGMIAEYQCIDDYELSEARFKRCQADGEFSSDEVICAPILCPVLADITYGTPKISEARVGDTNSYVCDTGYESHSEIVCLPSGQWNGGLEPCQLVECELIPEIENAVPVEETHYTYGDSAEYSCYDGYLTPEGSSVITILCQATGTFLVPEAGCLPVQCDLEANFEHGRLFHPDGGDAIYGDIVLLICDNGYQTGESQEVFCTATGEWDSEGTQCDIVQCGIAPKMPNARPVLAQDYVYIYSSAVKYTCDEGFMIVDPETLLTCQENGEFDNLDVEMCMPVSCIIPADIEQGSLASEEANYGEQLVVPCDDGFEIDGLGEQEITVTCQSDGEWSEDVESIICTPVICDPLEPLEFGSIILDDAIPKNASQNDGLFVYNSNIRYKCDRGYTLKGISKQTCLPNGAWTGTLPLCVPVECGSPPFILHGTITGDEESTYGNQISYECDDGYALDPPESVTRTCNEMGLWTGRHPLCLIVNCGPPSPVENGEIDSYAFTYGSVIGIMCDEGYIMTTGNDTRVCEIDGLWSDEDPVCEEISCGIHPEIEKGVVEPPDAHRIGEQVEITCDPGHELFGDAIRVCESAGEWEGIEPQCIQLLVKQRSRILADLSDKTCEPPAINASKVMMVDGQEEKSSYQIGEIIEYCCSPGFTPTTEMKLTCKDGTWDGEVNCIPQCRQKCRHGGRCFGENRCKCSHGWKGSRCHKPVCTSSCLNGGFCSGPYLCTCKEGWTGSRCQTAICTPPCQNGGRCVGPDECYCPYAYGGADCSERPFFSIW